MTHDIVTLKLSKIVCIALIHDMVILKLNKIIEVNRVIAVHLSPLVSWEM